MDDRIGQQLGSYRLLRVLGQGAQARVYLGEHQYLERPAAIKVLHTRLATDRHEAFRREAHTVASLDHPHIIGVYDFGIQDDLPYLIMPYTPYGSLRSRHQKGTPLPLEQILIYVKQIASALHYAHGQHVIHRDIKPENLLLTTSHEVVLSDFGIAVVAPALDSLSTQDPAGTPLYMAPEQIRGKPCTASDQYALAVMIYEWLIGEPPFRGSLYEVFNQHLHEPPPSLRARLPQLPPAIEDTIFGALAKDPLQRFSTVQDFAIVLASAFMATQPPALLQSPQDRTADNARPPLTQTSSSTRGTSASDHATQPHALTMQYEDGRPRSRISLPPTMQSVASNKALPQLSRTNRERLLRRVRSFWITGVLEHSLHGAALMALGLAAQPDAVANPWHLVIQHPDTAPRPLPAGTHITQVYDDADGELLILGAPGSGKTTLLLELARDLLDRAERDEQEPIPMVFNLSSWAMKKQSLAQWLVEELSTKYQVPRKLGQTLIDADQILPLLDGLDEVAAKSRTDCIETINTYRQAHGLLPLVICSRSADYLAQTTRVLLRSAVVVQPFSDQQIESYLHHVGPQGEALLMALHQDPDLQELATTPLMLSLLLLAYQGKPREQIAPLGTLPIKQQEVFATYVHAMLQRRGSHTSYTQEQTMHWLAYLARQIKQQHQTVFQIERMQSDWLMNSGLRRLYCSVAHACIYGLFSVSFVWLIAEWLVLMGGDPQRFPWLPILFSGFTIGPLVGLIMGLLKKHTTIKPAEVLVWSWMKMWKHFTGSLAIGLVGGLVFTLASSPLQKVSLWLLNDSVFGFTSDYVLSYTLVGLLWYSFSWNKFAHSSRIMHSHCVQDGAWNGVQVGVTVGLAALLIGSQIEYEIFRLLGYDLTRTLIGGLVEGIGGGIIAGLVFGLLNGLAHDTLDERHLVRPNQGIYHSAYNSIRTGSLGILSILLLVGIFFALDLGEFVGRYYFLLHFLPLNMIHRLVPFIPYQMLSWLVIGLVYGLPTGFIFGLLRGGTACLQHSLLRLFLWRTRRIPWNYARFLDYAAERILLCKVGGSYIFVHRSLLEYFASLETTTLSDVTKVQKQQAQSVS